MYCEVVVNVHALYDKRLTYRGQAEVGSLVRVPLGNRQAAAIVVSNLAHTDRPDEEIKEIIGPLYGGHVWLDAHLLSLADTIAEFYLCSYGAALELMLPVPLGLKETVGLKKAKVDILEQTSGILNRPKPAEFSPEQLNAATKITAAMTNRERIPYLLHGVTGSGKTEVYLLAIEHALSMGKQAIYLVPEISLTPQIVSILSSRFGDKLGVLHSGLSPGLRARTWKRIQAGEVRIVVGARSAVFAPVSNIGVIIVDEEHETSYRHEGGVNFHTRVVAQLRVNQQGGLVVLGSATPSLEVYSSAKRGKTNLLSMTSRPQGSSLPEVELIDMREQLRAGHKKLISLPLFCALEERLAAGEQGLLLYNRRGYAQFSLCQDCGHVPLCPHCDVSLHFHAGPGLLKCHYCGYTERVHRECKQCRSLNLRNRGAGTEKLEEELKELFPQYSTTRVDADTTSRKGAHQQLLSEFGSATSQIMLGTRMIAKGLDFPKVTVVGVIDADSGLFFPDFRAVEESFHLLMQVAGRSGRGKLKGKVYVQTFNPDHYCVRLAAEQNYQAFYKLESRLRKKLYYPPFGGLVTLHFRGADQSKVQATARNVARLFGSQAGTVLLGPIAASPERVKGIYRYQLSLKGESRRMLQNLLTGLKLQIDKCCSNDVNWFVVID